MAPEDSARILTDDIIRRYRHVMDDEEKRNAVVVKAVALIALAYGIPPIDYEPLDVNEVLRKLTLAEKVLTGD
jgi:hypothetical protein